jgi:hypothetical protein
LLTVTVPASTLQVSLQHVLVKALLWLISSTPPSKHLMAVARAPNASCSSSSRKDEVELSSHQTQLFFLD